jgi:hypothetical protein
MIPSCFQDAFAVAPVACLASCMSGVRDAFARLPSPFTLCSWHRATALHTTLLGVHSTQLVGCACNDGVTASHARKPCRCRFRNSHMPIWQRLGELWTSLGGIRVRES